LIPVRLEGFVMQQCDGKVSYSDALPWWLYDMRPQGYLGRAYAASHAAALGLPAQLAEWSDAHALRALLAHGHDAIGNLLLGDAARDTFLSATAIHRTTGSEKAAAYIRFAAASARGELPGSSAGGEQPKFVAYAETPEGPRHVIVKFTVADDNSVTERWRDLLLAEHLALDTLNAAEISAVQTRVMDFGTQRFLEIERFDRVGEFGRRGLFSLAALDAEFVGAGAGWSAIASALAKEGYIHPSAAAGAALLQAIGDLIGNTDMHTGNLSFVAGEGCPYDLAPAYDMLPMGFAPQRGGGIPSTLPAAAIHASIAPEVWRCAESVARRYVDRLRCETGFSPAFQPCIDALACHIETASGKIARLG
jgi:serine/threonine protein kinase HipA of HipAB toxin-antitoxin module